MQFEKGVITLVLCETGHEQETFLSRTFSNGEPFRIKVLNKDSEGIQTPAGMEDRGLMSWLELVMKEQGREWGEDMSHLASDLWSRLIVSGTEIDTQEVMEEWAGKVSSRDALVVAGLVEDAFHAREGGVIDGEDGEAGNVEAKGGWGLARKILEATALGGLPGERETLLITGWPHLEEDPMDDRIVSLLGSWVVETENPCVIVMHPDRRSSLLSALSPRNRALLKHLPSKE